MSQLVAYCDGSIEGGNPGGHAVGGWLVKSGKRVIAYGCVDLGDHPSVTNNMAEYAAVLGLVLWCVDTKTELSAVHSDSMLVVKQLAGEWKCSKPELRFFRDWVRNIGKSIHDLMVWVPRDKNWEADMISRRLYDTFGYENWQESRFPKARFHKLEIPAEMWLCD